MKTSVLPVIGMLSGYICDLRHFPGSDDLVFDAGNTDGSPRPSHRNDNHLLQIWVKYTESAASPCMYGGDTQ